MAKGKKDEDLSDEMRSLIALITDYKEILFQRIGDEAVKIFKKSFSDKSFNNTEWAPLTEKTKAYKYKKGYTQGALINTGDLLNSIKVIPRRLKEYDSVSIRSKLPYSVYQNEGTEHIPARPFMDDCKEIDDMIEREIDKLFTLI